MFSHLESQPKLRRIGVISSHFLALVAGRASSHAMRNGNPSRAFWFLVQAMRQDLSADAFRVGYREVAR
jgi:hypothetical protein